jgi:hypothetical protein
LASGFFSVTMGFLTSDMGTFWVPDAEGQALLAS